MSHHHTFDHDAIIVGAGFSGIYMLHKLRNELGLDAVSFEKMSGVGGTWQWNRYPGALSDTLSYLYCYSFDDELLRDFRFENRYVTQPEALKYLEHVVDRYDLQRSIQLNTTVRGAHFDEEQNVWTVDLGDGITQTCRFFVNAVGVVSEPIIPQFPGQDSFQGITCHTSTWPSNLDPTGKRVAVIGSGSSGAQLIPALARTAEQVTAFIRRPQYIVPIGNRPLNESEHAMLDSDHRGIWDKQLATSTAFGIEEEPSQSALEVSDEEREAAYEHAWNFGGPFHFYVGTYNDLITNRESNKTAAEFIQRKIREIVRDPEKARKLTPTDPWARRPVADSGFYEAFNRDNVDIVSLKETPIEEIAPKGIRTADGVEHEFDVIVYATGFDGFTGPYRQMNIVGLEGVTLAEQWRDGGSSYFGVAVSNFPNMFTVYGPYGPFSNNPPLIESEVEFITKVIGHAVHTNAERVSVDAAAEERYVADCEALARQTMLYDVDSWINGGNIPGKPQQLPFNLIGLGAFREALDEEHAQGFPGFAFEAKATMPAYTS